MSRDFEVSLPKELEEAKIEPTDVPYKEIPSMKSVNELKKALEMDKESILSLKEENKILRKRTELLIKSNKELVNLVLALEKKVKVLTDNIYEKHYYSYTDGGWIDKETGNKSVLEGPQLTANPQVINAQIEEILRLLKLHNKDKT